MSELTWEEWKSIGVWLVNGPRALLHIDDETGGKQGWLDENAGFERSRIAPDGRWESWKLYQRCSYYEDSDSTLPKWLVRAVVWESATDKALIRDGTCGSLSICVKHLITTDALAVQLHTLLDQNALKEDDDGILPHVIADYFGYKMQYHAAAASYKIAWARSTQRPHLTNLWQAAVELLKGNVGAAFPSENLVERYCITPHNTLIDLPGDALPWVNDFL